MRGGRDLRLDILLFIVGWLCMLALLVEGRGWIVVAFGGLVIFAV